MKRKYKKIIKLHEKIFWITLAVVVIAIFLFRREILYSSYSQIIVVRGFEDQGSSVYAKLFIKLSMNDTCNITARYANNTITKTIALNKTNLIKYKLPNMPIGHTKVFFKMKCKREEH